MGRFGETLERGLAKSSPQALNVKDAVSKAISETQAGLRGLGERLATLATLEAQKALALGDTLEPEAVMEQAGSLLTEQLEMVRHSHLLSESLGVFC